MGPAPPRPAAPGPVPPPPPPVNRPASPALLRQSAIALPLPKVRRRLVWRRGVVTGAAAWLLAPVSHGSASHNS
jgi:hypothetical protein